MWNQKKKKNKIICFYCIDEKCELGDVDLELKFTQAKSLIASMTQSLYSGAIETAYVNVYFILFKFYFYCCLFKKRYF